MWNARLEESQAGTRLPGEISTTSDMQMIQLQWQKVKRYWAHKESDTTERLNWTEEEPKSLLMTVKKESKKAGLKFNIQNTKIMASGPITSWQLEGEKMETMADFNFLGSKIIADSDHSHEIKRCLLLGRKAITNLLDSVLKSRHHLADKGPYSQNYGFSSRHVRMWELDYKEGWAPKNWCF